MRRISIYLLLFLLTAMLCACQSTAVSADGSSVLFGIPVCNADTAETLKAARTPSEILPTLYTQEDGDGIRHAIPLAQNEKTPTYYLPLDTDNPDWDSITLISDAALYIISDSALPDKARGL